jgi:hypothetical protein
MAAFQGDAGIIIRLRLTQIYKAKLSRFLISRKTIQKITDIC